MAHVLRAAIKAKFGYRKLLLSVVPGLFKSKRSLIIM